VSALLILACSATKRDDPGLLPAIKRYDGPAWRVLRKALRERPGLDLRVSVWSLSAEFGLIYGYRQIAWYDRKMTVARALELHPDVAALLHNIRLVAWDSVCLGLGKTYQQALPTYDWPEAMVLEGAIGERLKQLKEWLYAQ
jgi:hypothetical protein